MVDLEVTTIDKGTDDAFFEEEINLFRDPATGAEASCAICTCDVCLQAE